MQAAEGGSGPRAMRLACDPFGNYVLQRCFQVSMMVLA